MSLANLKFLCIKFHTACFIDWVFPVYEQDGLSRMQYLLLSASLRVMEVAPPFCPYFQVAEKQVRPRPLIE